jgi:hypothetical protein
MMARGLAAAAAAAAMAVWATNPVGALAGAESLRSASAANSTIAPVRHRRSTRCRGFIAPGRQFGPIIIEPGVCAPRAYSVDYRAAAAPYGW